MIFKIPQSTQNRCYKGRAKLILKLCSSQNDLLVLSGIVLHLVFPVLASNLPSFTGTLLLACKTRDLLLTLCQFYQHFTRSFFVHIFVQRFFFAYILG